MTKINFTANEKRTLTQAKKELLTDRNATFTSNARNNKKLIEAAEKYNVDIQVIWDELPTPKECL